MSFDGDVENNLLSILIYLQIRSTQQQGRFFYLIKFIKLVFRQINIVCIKISSLLIMKMDNLAIFSGCDSYVITYFLRCVAMKIVAFFTVPRIFI